MNFEKLWDLIRVEPRGAVDPKQIDWKQACYFLHANQLEGLVYHTHKDSLPAEIRHKFRGEWQNQWMRNQTYLEEYLRLKELLQTQGIEVSALKGAALLGDIYQDHGSRFMSDVDILLNANDLEPTISILEQNGFVVLKNNVWKANDFKVILNKHLNDIEITFELHTQLFYLEPDKMPWQVEPGPNSTGRLAPTSMLVHLLGHLGAQHSFLTLNWLVDIDRFVRKHQSNIDWAEAQFMARDLGQTRSFNWGLWACHKYLDLELPEPVVHLKAGGQQLRAKVMNDAYLWRSRDHFVRYQIIKHSMKDRFWEALIYDFLWFTNRAWR